MIDKNNYHLHCCLNDSYTSLKAKKFFIEGTRSSVLPTLVTDNKRLSYQIMSHDIVLNKMAGKCFVTHFL